MGPDLYVPQKLGENVGRVGSSMIRKAKAYEKEHHLLEQADAARKKAYVQVGIDKETGDQVTKVAAGVGVGLQAFYTIKKTMVYGTAGAAAYAIGKMGAPETTDKIIAETVEDA